MLLNMCELIILNGLECGSNPRLWFLDVKHLKMKLTFFKKYDIMTILTKEVEVMLVYRLYSQMKYNALIRFSKKAFPTFNDYVRYRYSKETDIGLELSRKVATMEKQYKLIPSREAKLWNTWIEQVKLDWLVMQNSLGI